jgi:hypothetical protein
MPNPIEITSFALSLVEKLNKLCPYVSVAKFRHFATFRIKKLWVAVTNAVALALTLRWG